MAAHCQQQVSYNTLGFISLVPGENSIINVPETDKAERYGRLEPLKATAHHLKSFARRDVLNFHGTCLLEGERSWGGQEIFLVVEASTLYDHGLCSEQLNKDKKPLLVAIGFARHSNSGFARHSKCKHNGSNEAIVQEDYEPSTIFVLRVYR